MKKFDQNEYKKEAFLFIDKRVDNFKRISDVKTDCMFNGGGDSRGDIVLSLIIPTYQRVSCFIEALKSALNQKNVDYAWELLIIDNTSLDDKGMTPALKIIKEINDNRIVYYHNRVNIGAGYNWNRGVELARGRWVSFLHDDDLLCSDALANIGKIIKNYNGKKRLGYIHAHRVKFSREFDEKKAKRKRWPVQLQLTQRLALIYGHTGTGAPSCGTTILKEAYIEAGGINYDFGPTADAVLGYHVMKNYAVIRSSEVLGGYRWADNETMHKETVCALLDSDKLFAEYRYSLCKFNSCWGWCFGDVINCINYKMKIKLLNESSEIIMPPRKPLFFIRNALYKILFYLYMISKVIKSI